MTGRNDPLFLSLETVYLLHRKSLQRHGGLDGVRDEGAIESALAAAQNTWLYGDGDKFDIAAAFAFHIAES
jgi:death-on-curing protein